MVTNPAWLRRFCLWFVNRYRFLRSHRPRLEWEPLYDTSSRCAGSGFSGIHGRGYDDVCDDCAGQGEFPMWRGPCV